MLDNNAIADGVPNKLARKGRQKTLFNFGFTRCPCKVGDTGLQSPCDKTTLPNNNNVRPYGMIAAGTDTKTFLPPNVIVN